MNTASLLYTLSEIADRTGIHVGRVSSRLRRIGILPRIAATGFTGGKHRFGLEALQAIQAWKAERNLGKKRKACSTTTMPKVLS